MVATSPTLALAFFLTQVRADARLGEATVVFDDPFVYVRQSERIRELAHTGTFLPETNAEALIKDIRPLIEEHIKLRLPGRFPPLKMLDGMIVTLRQQAPTIRCTRTSRTFEHSPNTLGPATTEAHSCPI